MSRFSSPAPALTPRSPRPSDTPTSRLRSPSPPVSAPSPGATLVDSHKLALTGGKGPEVKQVNNAIPSSSTKPVSLTAAAVAVAAPPPVVKELDAKEEVEEAFVLDGTDPVDEDVFEQIVELDEDDTYEFSHEMVVAYFTQAKTCFDDLDEAFKKKNLIKLSDLGHFLKGSSAALGIRKVQEICEKIQHLGKCYDYQVESHISEDDALKRIKPLLSRVKLEYAAAEKWLRKWYDDRGVSTD